MNKSEFTALLDACIETQKVTQDFKRECGTLLFNHSDIKEIYHVGLKDQEHIDFSNKMVEARKADKKEVKEGLPNIEQVN